MWNIKLFFFLAVIAIVNVQGADIEKVDFVDSAADKQYYKKVPAYCFVTHSEDDTKAADNVLRTDLDCSDDRPTNTSQDECKQLFRAVKGSSSADEEQTTDPLCYDSYYTQEAKWCAKTCNMCCLRDDYACEDSRPEHYKDEKTPYCKTKFYNTAMDKIDQSKCKADMETARKHCKQTCGLCNEQADAADGECADRNIGCKHLRELCADEDHKPRVERVCPRTCDLVAKEKGQPTTSCTKYKALMDLRKAQVNKEEGCKDTGSGCQTNVMLCEHENYMDKMQRSCRETCGVCVKQDFECKDLSTDCELWKNNDFCDAENGSFPRGVMVKHCAKTCKLCT